MGERAVVVGERAWRGTKPHNAQPLGGWLEKAQAPGVYEDAGGFTLQSPDGIRYRVDICEQLFAADQPLLGKYCDGRHAVVFLSPTVDRLYGARIRAYFSAHIDPDRWSLTVIGTGEQRKTLASAEAVCAIAEREGLDRRGLMVAIGGGIVCDIVGFAASVYARGMDFIKVNTTLVGQVDVGVGIKVGVNAWKSKNLLGGYHPAHASINDVSLLRTLPEREIRCGLSEIIKMAIIRDESFFHLLRRHSGTFTEDPDAAASSPSSPLREHIIRTAMRLMLEELCPNLREHNLARLVDFGHTFSPTIEVASQHRIAHGEAVAIDMALSSVIARTLGILDHLDCEEILRLLESVGLPTFDRQTCTAPTMREALASAALRRGRKLNLVVPTGLGSATFVVDTEDLPDGVLREALSTLSSRATRMHLIHEWHSVVE